MSPPNIGGVTTENNAGDEKGAGLKDGQVHHGETTGYGAIVFMALMVLCDQRRVKEGDASTGKRRLRTLVSQGKDFNHKERSREGGRPESGKIQGRKGTVDETA